MINITRRDFFAIEAYKLLVEKYFEKQFMSYWVDGAFNIADAMEAQAKRRDEQEKKH